MNTSIRINNRFWQQRQTIVRVCEKHEMIDNDSAPQAGDSSV